MRYSFLFIIILSLSGLLTSRGVEHWSDPNLTAKDGLEVWLDAGRQKQAHSAMRQRPLFPGAPLSIVFDASGHHRDFLQPSREARPLFYSEGITGQLRFDGKDDVLTCYTSGTRFTNATIFIVTAPGTNSGVFRCFLSMAKSGENDYTSGLNIDLGPGPGVSFSSLNVEGAGAGGVANLLQDRSTLGVYRVLSLVSTAAKGGVRLFADGKAQSKRDREVSVIQADQMILGARFYSNEGEAPYANGFFGGEIAEVLVYARALGDAERTGVESYLNKKYAALLSRGTKAQGGFNPLAPILEPPPVQIFLPGFASRALPLSLPNINCVKYRADGKLVALGYNGNIYLLSDANGDGIEEKVEFFWQTNSLRAPIGMALTPPGYALGEGVFVAAKGKVSLVLDTNHDDHADKEIVLAQGWKELSHGVDALGVAVDKQGSVYFGLGVADFTNPYLIDRATGQSRFDLNSERGTILKISSDFKTREVICRGIRFPVALAFNATGDLFCTDQEGATWLPNGNPLDELLHIQPSRYYGFPPRHPQYLPGVIDEPSTFDYAPQHQSLCGVNFNPAAGEGKVFGPPNWAGDAFLSGYSRGKLYRTKLVKIASGYVAESQLIAALNMLTVDACVSPRGDLVVATHSGQPDWGSGPTGAGKLFQIRHADPAVPQPLLAFPASPTETHVVFDRALTPEQARKLVQEAAVAGGKYLVAGERFESLRPGYQVVQDQLATERIILPVLSSQLSADHRTLAIQTSRRVQAIKYAITLGGFTSSRDTQVITQHQKIDLAFGLHGVEAKWANRDDEHTTWLPHLDGAVARELTTGSFEHETYWKGIEGAGPVSLRTQLNLWHMLRPAVQPGSKLDYEFPAEEVFLTFSARTQFKVKALEKETASKQIANGNFETSLAMQIKKEDWVPLEIYMNAGAGARDFSVAWHTAEDSRKRPLPLHRMLLPWAVRSSGTLPESRPTVPPEIAKANWLHGRRIFFGEKAACATCHRIRGEGHLVGPDLSNLIHRDYNSVLKDIATPNATINPDHVNYQLELNDGESVSGVLQRESSNVVTLAQAGGRIQQVKKTQVRSMTPSSLSLMPEGLTASLGSEAMRDLMKFLLTSPLEPATLKTEAPALRSPQELAAVSAAATNHADNLKPFRILLVAGPKDHGPDEHDYPAWQERWAKLLALADNVTVTTAFGWPSREALQNVDVAVFYSNNPGWSAARASELESFQARGGGLVYLHFAVDGHEAVKELSERIGLAWRTGSAKFRHGPLNLAMNSNHPITRGFSQVQFYDESYWDLEGDPDSISILGTGEEAQKPRPLLWTRENGPGRVFVSIPGHYTWTFDDPAFRLILLRAISWVAHEPVERLSELALIGARMNVLATETN